MILDLSYPVSANRYWRNVAGRMVRSEEANAYKREAAQLAMLWRIKPMAGPVSVAIVLHPKTNKDGSASARRLDLDNCIKVALDALNGIAYADDAQVVRLRAEIGEAVQRGALGLEWEAA